MAGRPDCGRCKVTKMVTMYRKLARDTYLPHVYIKRKLAYIYVRGRPRSVHTHTYIHKFSPLQSELFAMRARYDIYTYVYEK